MGLNGDTLPERVQTSTGQVWLSESGIIHVTVSPRVTVDLSDAKEITDAITKTAKNQKRPTLFHVGSGATQTPAARRYRISAAGFRYISAVALISENHHRAGLANFFMNLSPPPVPLKIFSKLNEANAWLSEYIDTEADDPNMRKGQKFSIYLKSESLLEVVWNPDSHVTTDDAHEVQRKRDDLCREFYVNVLVDMTNVVSTSKEARGVFANYRSKTKAVAMVVTSAIGRTIGNFFINVNKPSTPTKLFSSRERALSWFESLETKTAANEEPLERTAELLDALASFAALDFSKKVETNDPDPVFNQLAFGINMLGEELQYALQKNTESQNRHATILDNLPGLIAWIGDDLKIKLANQGYAKHFGSTKNSLVGQHISNVLGNEFFQEVAPHMKDAINGKDVSFQIKKKSKNSEITLDVNYVSEKSRGIGTGFYALIQDATAHQKLVETTRELELKAELDKAREKTLLSSRLASIGELAAGVGHEINNPLAIAGGNVDSLAREFSDKIKMEPKLKDRFDKIKVAHWRIRNIVDGLRTYARADTDQLEDVSLRKAVEQTVSLMSEILEKEGVSIATSIEDGDFFVKGSLGKIQQVIMNLISNARDASQDQKNRLISISLSDTKSNEGCVTVEDNGSGIPEDKRKRIFDAFFTTKPLGQGTGMGLGIVTKIVSELSGHIELESEVGKGSKFLIYFPLIETPFVSEVNEQKEVTTETSKAALPNEKSILVVDDEPGIREILIETLNDIGFENVAEAENGEAGLTKITEGEFDLVFTDIRMPVMDGVQLMREVRKLDLKAPPLLIAVTGGTTNNFTKEGRGELSDLIDAYVLKPFSEDQVRDAIESALNVTTNEREAA